MARKPVAAQADRGSRARSSSSSFAWPRRTVIGAMTGSLGRWPIWGIRSAIRRSAMSCNATVCRWHRNASARAHGRPSFVPTWRCWRGPTFSPRKFLTLRRLVTYYVLFFIYLESRQVVIAGITVHPDEASMKQMARNVTMEGCGILGDCRYLLHDRDTKYTRSFRAIIASGQVEPLALAARCPNLNAYAERWVRSVKEECLSKVILLGRVLPAAGAERIRRALSCRAESPGQG